MFSVNVSWKRLCVTENCLLLHHLSVAWLVWVGRVPRSFIDPLSCRLYHGTEHTSREAAYCTMGVDSLTLKPRSVLRAAFRNFCLAIPSGRSTFLSFVVCSTSRKTIRNQTFLVASHKLVDPPFKPSQDPLTGYQITCFGPWIICC